MVVWSPCLQILQKYAAMGKENGLKRISLQKFVTHLHIEASGGSIFSSANVESLEECLAVEPDSKVGNDF